LNDDNRQISEFAGRVDLADFDGKITSMKENVARLIELYDCRRILPELYISQMGIFARQLHDIARNLQGKPLLPSEILGRLAIDLMHLSPPATPRRNETRAMFNDSNQIINSDNF
jgi:hypothetical protein